MDNTLVLAPSYFCVFQRLVFGSTCYDKDTMALVEQQI